MAIFFKKYTIHVLLCLASGVALLCLFRSAKSDPDIVITLDAHVQYDDSFQLFYVSTQKEWFSEEESIRAPVKGSKEDQKIRFAVPSGVVLKPVIRIDLGDKLPNNVGNEIVTLKAIHFKNAWYERVIPGKMIMRHFSANIPAVADAPGSFITQAIDGGYDPLLISLDTPEMTSMLQGLDKPALSDMLRSVIMMIMFWCTLVFSIFYFLPPATEAARSLKIGFVVIFVVILCVPICAQLFFPAPEGVNAEKRVMAKLPAFSLRKQFARDFEAYYNDNFAFRSWLIETGSFVKYKLFNTAMNPDKAMIGENGFMFYNNPNDNVFGSYTHRNLHPTEELLAYTRTIEAQQAKCAAMGTIYIKGFWPSSHTIYPEYLPEAMRMQVIDTVSRAQQIMEHLKKTNSPIKFVDVTDALMAAKKDHLLYLKFDTHWNDYGAYIGYKSLFEQCYDELHIKPFPISDFNITWEDSKNQRDLLNMIGMGNDMKIMEKAPVFTLKDRAIPYKLTNSTEYSPRTIISTCETCPDPRKVVIFRDSYTMALVQFYSLHFREIIYIWVDSYDQDVVDKIKPDIVMHIPSERYL